MKTIRFYKEFGEYGYLATYSKHGFLKDGIYYPLEGYLYPDTYSILKTYNSKQKHIR